MKKSQQETKNVGFGEGHMHVISKNKDTEPKQIWQEQIKLSFALVSVTEPTLTEEKQNELLDVLNVLSEVTVHFKILI